MIGDLLSVENVTRSYALGGLFGRGHFNAVEEVSFAIPDGRPEIFTIVGESGSGKSTLAKMILNLAVPTRGRICLRGTDVTTARDRRGRLAFMAAVQPIFQNPFEAFSPLKRVDAYLLKTARTFAGRVPRPKRRRPPTQRCAMSGSPMRRSSDASRMNCPAARSSESRLRGR